MKKNTLPSKITREIDSNGIQSFSGIGGGVLQLQSGGKIGFITDGAKRCKNVELLWELWDRDPLTSGDIDQNALEQKKGCSQILLKALYERDAQFFRDLGDYLKPRPYAVEAAKSKKHEKERKREHDEVFKSIKKAVKEAGTVPYFEDLLETYRQHRFFQSESPAHFKRKLVNRGFGWLAENTKKSK
ncbi:MAG: hypothetical protein ACK5JP_07955 [Akkermansiaceae bacterium]|jgi:hypothetical protein